MCGGVVIVTSFHVKYVCPPLSITEKENVDSVLNLTREDVCCGFCKPWNPLHCGGCVFVAPWKGGFTNFVFPIVFTNAYHTRIIFYMVFCGIVENQLIFATFPLRKIYATHQTMKMREHGCGEMNGCTEMKSHGCVLKVPFMFFPLSFSVSVV